MENKPVNVLNKAPRYSLPWKKKLAKEYHLKEEHVVKMDKHQCDILELGIWAGLAKASEDMEQIKKDYFMVPIHMWNHRKDDFMKILAEEMEELKNAEVNKERNDDSAVETESDGEGETENSEEQ